MQKTFTFGKIDLNNCGRRINAVDVTVCLEEKESGKLVFTASGNIWNSKHTDIEYGGQCLDAIAETSVGSNSTFKEIYRLWKLYHLNNMHAGTPKQEAYLKSLNAPDITCDYKSTCKALESADLLNDNGYTYGLSWLYEPIPEADLNRIKELFAD